MGLFDKIQAMTKPDGAIDKGGKNVGEITAQTAADFIKNLSGSDIIQTRKLIDNILVFSSASGGAGATTVMSNIAYTAAKRGLRVMVIDMNILTPLQHLYFNSKQEIQKSDLVGYLLGKNSLGEAIENLPGNISLMYANNRSLMDLINCEEDAAVNNFMTMIEKFRQLFDLVLIDCPVRVEHTLINTAFYLADTIYMVWDEGIGSIANTEKIRRNMGQSGIEAYVKMKVILNKRTSIQYSQYPFEKLNIELIGILPFESDIIASSLKSEIFCDKGASRSPNAAIFCGTIEDITDKITKMGGKVK